MTHTDSAQLLAQAQKSLNLSEFDSTGILHPEGTYSPQGKRFPEGKTVEGNISLPKEALEDALFVAPKQYDCPHCNMFADGLTITEHLKGLIAERLKEIRSEQFA